MGNCQAIDNATLIIQHPSGKVDHLFKPVLVNEIMKLNPGHYVALLLATTLYSSAAVAASGEKSYAARVNNTNIPLRVTRIKLLRPTDSLILGHVYRLVTSQDVMKGLGEKKIAKMKEQSQQRITEKQSSDFHTDVEKTKQVNRGRQKSRNGTSVNASSKHRTWQPSLNSISEAAI